nr:cyclodeaminase/cyclohydrolase family protein [Collinsella urealyticum]
MDVPACTDSDTYSIADITIRSFTTSLAAPTPAPGGGAAAAVVGALGSALCSMALTFRARRAAEPELAEKLASIEVELQRIMASLLELADQDAEGFLPLSRAFALSRKDPNRSSAIDAGARCASQAPLAAMSELCRAIELIEQMSRLASSALMADVAGAAELAAAALFATSLNVYANARLLADSDEARALIDRTEEMLASADRARRLARSIAEHSKKGL